MAARIDKAALLATAAAVLLAFVPGARPELHADEFAAELPVGVPVVWDLDKAAREATPTSERVCINGLWRWQPGDAAPTQSAAPTAGWGFFKVPGCWPGITDYMQKDSQTLYPHPAWKNTRLASVTTAWYEREVTIPGSWTGRRIALAVEYLNSFAAVSVDGRPVGELRFPGGNLDLSPVCRPGGRYRLSLRVDALPLKGVMVSYVDTATARTVKGTVPRRGLCGDVYLVGTTPGARITDVKVDTSVRQGRIAFDAALAELVPGTRYFLRAVVTQNGEGVAGFNSNPIAVDDLQGGRFTFGAPWKPDRLWDVHRPGNQYVLKVSLLDADSQVLDTAHDVPFGFREFWIDGRDFYLNGTRIFLCAVPFDNAQIGAAMAGYEGARESLLRLKSIGINMVYTHNYGCEPGSHLSFAEVLRAADDVGMLVSFSQPHFSHYDWQADDADANNGYRRHAEFYVRRAQNHPAVVFYSMSHNGTGYSDDMNPEMIDGIHDPREGSALRNVKRALRAEAIVRRLDPGRIVYHHAGGNTGVMHTSNFYPNFVPIQELSDWFEHWATAGVKPMFTCEYGAPFTWDWAMYRGWYKGERSFGSARVPWEFCMSEWNAQFFGDRAFPAAEPEKANLRWEAKQYRAGNLWHRWDYPYELGSRVFDERHEVIGRYLADNWRAFRTWGVSGISPWEHGHFWKQRDGLERRRHELPVDWDHLQRPGFSADFIDARYERVDLAFDRSDWVATADGAAILRNNQPLLAYIAGPRIHFTSKEHTFRAGETVEKQLIMVNNSRETVTADCRWTLGPLTGNSKVSVATGQQERVLLRFPLPGTMAPGTQELRATVKFSTGETQDDTLAIHVLPQAPERAGNADPAATQAGARVALFDPGGETRMLLDGLGFRCRAVDAGADLSDVDLLIVGKAALSVDGPAPAIGRVRDGLRVIVFEQTRAVLEKRLGFRATEYGLRQVFPRLSDHPLLAGIAPEHLRDWRGEATIIPPRLAYEMRPQHGPTVEWCGIPVSRAWRCGNRGNVASVLIEKPARGRFLPVIDGGYSLQYSPLLEYSEGQGMILFCQLDVTGRTETEPAAELLVRNLLRYALAWKPAPSRSVVYAGEAAGARHLAAAGFAATEYAGGHLGSDAVFVVGPEGGKALAAHAGTIADWVRSGGHVLAIGLDEPEARSLLPIPVRMESAEHISTGFDVFGAHSLLAGVGPADVHNRDPRVLPLVTGGAGVTAIGNGVLAHAVGANVVFCQLVPWQYASSTQPNLRRTCRRVSFLMSRLLAGMGAGGTTPVLDRFATPVAASARDERWRDGLYLDQPEEWDDPYRFFRW
jgi:hypothetical protein